MSTGLLFWFMDFSLINPENTLVGRQICYTISNEKCYLPFPHVLHSSCKSNTMGMSKRAILQSMYICFQEQLNWKSLSVVLFNGQLNILYSDIPILSYPLPFFLFHYFSIFMWLEKFLYLNSNIQNSDLHIFFILVFGGSLYHT